jgi:hypothetical protein
MDFGKALSLNLVGGRELASVYRILIKILNEEECSERLLLYFPIELIPGIDWDIGKYLKRVADDFVEVYIRKWHELLLRQDIRANFVDGDIPEIETRSGPLPKVVKAAHLIPALVSKGILTYNDVCIMMDECSNRVLRESIAEILPFCTTRSSTAPTETTAKNVDWLISYIKESKEKLELLLKSRKTNSQSKPEKRINWEMERDTASSVDDCSQEIAKSLVSGNLEFNRFKFFLENTIDEYGTLIGITSLRKTLSSLAQHNLVHARNTFLEFESLIDRLWETKQSTVQECIEVFWTHLYASNIVTEKHLRDRSVITANFEGNLGRKDSVSNLATQIVCLIKQSNELMSVLMPISIAYGSRVKGYNSRKADDDVAIFVRPGISIDQRHEIQGKLAEHLKTFGVASRVFEFWLEETKYGLKVRDFANPDRLLGDSLLVHVLFGGVWYGEHKLLSELYRSLLFPYLNPTDKTINGQSLREFWLEEMERDALQYRLMHKGYHRFNPERRTTCIPDSIVDARGAFWDSGYRRLATKLFLKKVFLPPVYNKQE